jgi:hypothetical protein
VPARLPLLFYTTTAEVNAKCSFVSRKRKDFEFLETNEYFCIHLCPNEISTVGDIFSESKRSVYLNHEIAVANTSLEH